MSARAAFKAVQKALSQTPKKNKAPPVKIKPRGMRTAGAFNKPHPPQSNHTGHLVNEPEGHLPEMEVWSFGGGISSGAGAGDAVSRRPPHIPTLPEDQESRLEKNKRHNRIVEEGVDDIIDELLRQRPSRSLAQDSKGEIESIDQIVRDTVEPRQSRKQAIARIIEGLVPTAPGLPGLSRELINDAGIGMDDRRFLLTRWPATPNEEIDKRETPLSENCKQIEDYLRTTFGIEIPICGLGAQRSKIVAYRAGGESL